MFLQAGFNPRCRVIARGWIGKWGWRGGPRPSALVRFECGDYAWWGRGGITWADDSVMILTLREVLGTLERGGYPSSPWPRKKKGPCGAPSLMASEKVKKGIAGS